MSKLKKPKVCLLENDKEYDFVAKVVIDGKKIVYGDDNAMDAMKGLRDLLQDHGYRFDEIDWDKWLAN